jgi:hypothetical protein
VNRREDTDAADAVERREAGMAEWIDLTPAERETWLMPTDADRAESQARIEAGRDEDDFADDDAEDWP